MKYSILEDLAKNLSNVKDLLRLAQIDGYKEDKKYSSKTKQHELEKKVFKDIIEYFEKKEKNQNGELGQLETSKRLTIVQNLVCLLIDIREKRNQKSGSGFYKYYGDNGRTMYELMTKKFKSSSALYGNAKHNAIYELLDSLLKKGYKRKKYEKSFLNELDETEQNDIDKTNSALEKAFKQYVKKQCIL